MMRAGKCNEPVGDVCLRRRRFAAALAGKFEGGAGMGERQHAGIDQRVMHDDIGLGEAGERVEREQARVARPGASKPYMPGLEPGKSRHGVAQAVGHAWYPSR